VRFTWKHSAARYDLWGAALTCKSCGSGRQRKFNGEIAVHYPGLEGLNKPIVWVFPNLLVCLNCGLAEFSIPDEELQGLAKDDLAAAASASAEG
jgi:hypothetical protein